MSEAKLSRSIPCTRKRYPTVKRVTDRRIEGQTNLLQLVQRSA